MLHLNVRNIAPDGLRSVVVNAAMRRKMLSENGVYHIKHAL